MADLLEITADDIAQFDDADLRTLIGLLCEADYRQAGLSTNGITWGGHQDAPDGGLDVIVCDKMPPPQTSFVPRSVTGFQVKKPDMSKSKIPGEMKPKGILRAKIKDLINDNGAYIIVSSGASTTGTALSVRIDAMREVVSTEDNHKNLHLDFFDRGRVATWLRSHPSLILWVFDKIGRQLKGWCPYKNWANPKAGIDEEYLLDDGLRLHDGTRQKDKGMSVQDGLLQLRSALSVPGASVRLAGLSGVGKTRLAQAMFDDRVEGQALNPNHAFYTDITFSPDPDPRAFAEQLIAGRTRAILIVDNCTPELHNLLTKTCSVKESTVSLLTIEYDVRDDVPEETSVFRLEPASEDLIKKLIRKRFTHINQVDAQTIATFSGGNARIAIALSNTVKKDETLSGFRDENLFERLFEQRHGSDQNLLMSAEACSLVYSFEGTNTESEKSELNVLASLINKSGHELYRDVTTIKDRDLIQSRDVWRAVLPQAIADRLAKRALESIPKETIVKALLNSGSERLIKSFSRRLGYLHDCKRAVEMVEKWLFPDGWIGKANCNFNDFGMDVFRNIAPVSPEKTLETIEKTANGADGSKFTSRENSHHDKFVWLLRHLAYDPELFDRSAEIICRFALSEETDENRNSARDVLKSLFYIYLSGTLAPVETRATLIQELVDSENENRQELGLILLDAALESWHFSSSYEFGFGARSRDFGYQPKMREDIEQWFGTFIDICKKVAISDKPIAQKARTVLADRLRGLWLKTKMFDILEDSAIEISKQQPWNEGWIAVKKIIRYDRKRFPEEVLARIDRLEKNLRPKSLYELVHTYVLSSQHVSFGLSGVDDDDDEAVGWEKDIESSHSLGIQVAQDGDTLKLLLPELVSASNQRIRSFGRGLAEDSSDRQSLWQAMRDAYESTEPEKRRTCVMEGFLSACAEIEPELFNEILDSLISDESLGEYFPIFQATSDIDHRGVERLNQALDAGKAKVEYFRCLAWGRAHEAISDDDLAILLEKILSREDGISIATDILMMRFHRQKEIAEYSTNLLAVARDALCMYQFSKDRRSHDNQNHELSHIANICLNGKDGSHAAEKLCRHLSQAIINDRIYTFDYPTLFSNISRAQPFVFLDAFIGNDKIKTYLRVSMFSEGFENRDNPFDQISDDDLISWCEKDPGSRYPLIASAIQLFTECDGRLEWKDIVSRIFDRAPELEPIFDSIAYSMIPKSWSDSRADIMQRRSALYKELYQHDNSEIRSLAKAKYSDLQRKIIEQRKIEVRLFKTQFESFE